LSQTEKDFDKPLFLCLDEFTNFGRIPDFVNKTTIIRHRKIGAILGFQDYMQLEKTYGRDDAKILWGSLAQRSCSNQTTLILQSALARCLAQSPILKGQ